MAAITEHNLPLPELGLSTRVLEAGAGSTVLMLHGNPDNADEWQKLIGHLSTQYRCIAPDFPGYGKSPEPPTSFSYSLADQMRFVDAVLAALKVTGPVAMVVHDTGGMVGTAWTVANLGRVCGVVVTNTVAFEGFHWFKIARTWGGRTLLDRLRAGLGMRVLALRHGGVFRKVFGAQSPQLSSAELERFSNSFALNPVAKRVTLRQFRLCTLPEFFAGFDAHWVKINQHVPVRVLWGEGDPYIGVPYAQRFGTTVVKVLPGAGHWVPIIAAAQLASEVRALG